MSANADKPNTMSDSIGHISEIVASAKKERPSVALTTAGNTLGRSGRRRNRTPTSCCKADYKLMYLSDNPVELRGLSAMSGSCARVFDKP